MILNFAESDTTSSLANQDNWLLQFQQSRGKKNQAKLVMYGDDTWLKLFPDTFLRADGTSSFFVSVRGFLLSGLYVLFLDLETEIEVFFPPGFHRS